MNYIKSSIKYQKRKNLKVQKGGKVNVVYLINIF